MSPMEIAGADSRFVATAGLNTHYYVAGNGAPLMLLHGGGAGADSYANWRGCLAKYAGSHRVHAVDMVGFGHTDQPDPEQYRYTQQARVEHIIALIEALGLRRVSIIGNSMGGYTAMGVAIERPDLVDRLVLMGSAGIRAPISEQLKSIINYDYTPEGMRRIVQGLTNPDFVADPDLVEYRYRLSLRPQTRAAYGAVMQWQRDNDGFFYEEDYIRRVSQRALIVNGKMDLVVPVTSAYRLLDLIENSWGYIIPHCGHWAMIERPREFVQATLAFLAAD